jgi:hypothetical protein
MRRVVGGYREILRPANSTLRSGEARSAVLVPCARRAMIRREKVARVLKFCLGDEAVSSLEDASKGRRDIGFLKAGFLRVAVR